MYKKAEQAAKKNYEKLQGAKAAFVRKAKQYEELREALIDNRDNRGVITLSQQEQKNLDLWK